MPSSLPVKKKPASPAKKQAGPVRKPAGPAKKQAGPAKKPASPVKKQAGPAKKQAGPAKKPASPVRKQAGPAKKPAGPAKKPAGPVRKPASPAKKPASPVKKQAGPAKKPASPAKKQTTKNPAAAKPGQKKQRSTALIGPAAAAKARSARKRAGNAKESSPHFGRSFGQRVKDTLSGARQLGIETLKAPAEMAQREWKNIDPDVLKYPIHPNLEKSLPGKVIQTVGNVALSPLGPTLRAVDKYIDTHTKIQDYLLPKTLHLYFKNPFNEEWKEETMFADEFNQIDSVEPVCTEIQEIQYKIPYYVENYIKEDCFHKLKKRNDSLEYYINKYDYDVLKRYLNRRKEQLKPRELFTTEHI